jgi:hypothetical protein
MLTAVSPVRHWVVFIFNLRMQAHMRQDVTNNVSDYMKLHEYDHRIHQQDDFRKLIYQELKDPRRREYQSTLYYDSQLRLPITNVIGLCGRVVHTTISTRNRKTYYCMLENNQAGKVFRYIYTIHLASR